MAVIDYTGAEASAFIPEVWEAIANEVRWANLVVAKPGVINYIDASGKMRGDIVHIATMPKLTVNAVTVATGAIAPQSPTITDTTITLDNWNEMSVEVTQQVSDFAYRDVLQAFAEQFGVGLAAQMDIDVLAQHASVTTNVVGDLVNPEQLSASLLLAAAQKLDDLDIPLANRSWCFAPVAKAMLLKDSQYVDAFRTGDSKGGVRTGEIGTLYATPVLITSGIATSGVLRKNMLFHKDAFAICVNHKLRIQKLATGITSNTTAGAYLVNIIVADALYGEGIPRQNHACVVNTATT